MATLETYERHESKETYGKEKELKELEEKYNEDTENAAKQFGGEVEEFEKKMRPLWLFKKDILNPWVEKLESENELTAEEKKELQDLWTDIWNEYEKGGFLEIAKTPEKYYINISKLTEFINTVSDNKKKVLIKVLNATAESTNNNERVKLILDWIEKTDQ